MGNDNRIKLAIFDSTSNRMAKTSPVMILLVKRDGLTAKELIYQRVKMEVDAFHQRRESMHSLVKYCQSKSILVKDLLKKSLDAETLAKKALEAFERNEYCLFVDDRQISELDELVDLHENSQVEFFRLVRLVGG